MTIEQKELERKALKRQLRPHKHRAARASGGDGGIDGYGDGDADGMEVEVPSDDDEAVEMLSVDSTDSEDDAEDYFGIPRQPPTLTNGLWGQLCRQFNAPQVAAHHRRAPTPPGSYTHAHTNDTQLATTHLH